MTLSVLMKEGGLRQLATAISATAATAATDGAERIARVATVAVAGHKTQHSEHAAGWPLDDRSRAPFCPWGPRITPAMLDVWRSELREVVAALAAIEGWSEENRAYIAYQVEHQPSLSTVRDDLAWFRDRLNTVRGGAAQRVQQLSPPIIPGSGTGRMP